MRVGYHIITFQLIHLRGYGLDYGPQVIASSLDSEFRTSTLDLLLISVAGEEMEVLRGAQQMLLQQRVKRLMTFTWNQSRLREHLIPLGYQFIKEHQLEKSTSHVIRAIKTGATRVEN